MWVSFCVKALPPMHLPLSSWFKLGMENTFGLGRGLWVFSAWHFVVCWLHFKKEHAACCCCLETFDYLFFAACWVAAWQQDTCRWDGAPGGWTALILLIHFVATHELRLPRVWIERQLWDAAHFHRSAKHGLKGVKVWRLFAMKVRANGIPAICAQALSQSMDPKSIMSFIVGLWNRQQLIPIWDCLKGMPWILRWVKGSFHIRLLYVIFLIVGNR